MLPVIAYIRVSTKQQALNGTSLDGQKLQISVYAKHRELRVTRWFKDDSSARNEEEGSERHDFKAACDLALKKGWPILVVDASRFSRTEESYERFISAGGKVYDLSGFGADEAEMAAKIARAKFDGDKRAKATREGQKKAKAAGVRFGTPAPQKAAAASAISRGKDAGIRRSEIERLHDQAIKEGVTGPRELADWLNRKGRLTAQGERWTTGNVRRVLGRAKQPAALCEPPIQLGVDTALSPPTPAQALAPMQIETNERTKLSRYELEAVKEIVLPKLLTAGHISREKFDRLMSRTAWSITRTVREKLLPPSVRKRAVDLWEADCDKMTSTGEANYLGKQDQEQDNSAYFAPGFELKHQEETITTESNGSVYPQNQVDAFIMAINMNNTIDETLKLSICEVMRKGLTDDILDEILNMVL